ncbi:CoA transferase [Delftia acidovorans]|uniref:CoA transferase n=1 Tax=Delftia acidovorans TaxID=80866 RepID=UPI0015D64374|nr:CoA transferase [Delftia acidovorans]MCG3783432.1 CoA transferase [Delftia acidovorans]
MPDHAPPEPIALQAPLSSSPTNGLPLSGVRILSLALNLPGPAALMRCAAMGAQCSKLEPPSARPASGSAAGAAGADPMAHYSPQAYADMHQGIAVWQAQLKSEEGQAALHDALDAADILLTSFRPAALAKLGLDWASLQQRHPQLSLVRIVGSAGALADVPGHDLTYQAEAGLVQGGAMPPSLFADMAGALMASEAVLKAWLLRQRSGHGSLQETGLAQAAQWLALPWHWGLTRPDGDVGGAHAGYRVYACADGSVAVAALEPHFAARLCAVASVNGDGSIASMRSPAMHAALQAFLAPLSCAELADLAEQHDLPLHPLPGPPQAQPRL